MVFKNEIVKKFIEKKTGYVVENLFKVNDSTELTEDININSDCNIVYYVDVDSILGYERFHMKQFATSIEVDYDELLKFSRNKKLQNFN